MIDVLLKTVRAAQVTRGRRVRSCGTEMTVWTDVCFLNLVNCGFPRATGTHQLGFYPDSPSFLGCHFFSYIVSTV